MYPARCSSQFADHACTEGSPFDCFDMHAAKDARMAYNQLEELYKTWWSAKQFPIPIPFPTDWKRDLPLPIQNVTISFRDTQSMCLTIWSFAACLVAVLGCGVWLFLIFHPLSDAVWYNVFLFAMPIVAAVMIEMMSFNIAAGHKSVADFAKRFFPHVQGLGLFDHHLSNQIEAHMKTRQFNMLALSNLLIIANLVSSEGQRQALQTVVTIVFAASIISFQQSTVNDRMGAEFYGSKVILQIHNFFEEKGFSPKGPTFFDNGALRRPPVDDSPA